MTLNSINHIFSSEKNNNDELAFYTSFEEAPPAEEKCVFCGQSDENSFEFGKKVSFDNITAHHFCLVGS